MDELFQYLLVQTQCFLNGICVLLNFARIEKVLVHLPDPKNFMPDFLIH